MSDDQKLEFDWLIVCALQIETTAIARLLENKQSIIIGNIPVLAGQIKSARIALLTTGPGRKRVRQVLPLVLNEIKVSQILNAGLCGGLTPGLSMGDLTVPEVVMDEQGQRIELAPWIEHIQKSMIKKTLLSVVHPRHSREAKEQAFRVSSAQAVDMEAFFLAEIAHSQQLPLTVIKGVSDDVLTDFPIELIQVMKPDGGVHWSRLAGLIFFRPGMIVKLLRLQKSSQLAMTNVSKQVVFQIEQNRSNHKIKRTADEHR